MKEFRFGAAALLLGAFIQCAAAKTASPPAKPVKTPATEAGALLQALAIPCTVSGAQKLAAPAAPAPARGKSRPPAAPDRYEASCQPGLGYLLTAARGAGERPEAQLCIESGATCTLPGNHADAQRAAVAGLLERSRRSGCTIDRYRFAARSVVNTYIEIACHGGEALMLAASNPLDPAGRVEALPCLSLPAEGPLACVLANRESMIAALAASAEAQFTRESGRIACKVHGRRFILADRGGNTWFEMQCQDGAGYIMARLANGAFGGSDSCDSPRAADLGGCRLAQKPNDNK